MNSVRGYMGARLAMGRSVPQHVQQLVMRDYCQRRGLHYLLAATEHRMPGCTLVLDGILDELDRLDGVVMYSLFLLPTDRAKRAAVIGRMLAAGRTLHLAAEGLAVATDEDARRLEDIWLVMDVLEEQDPRDLEALAR
jgi:sporadic carbohydrate cluster protein (TIGR04323 family)